MNMDRKRFEKMYRDCFRRIVVSLIHRFRLREEDACDIASAAFLEAFENGEYDPDKERLQGAYIQWLAAKRALDFLRTRKRRASKLQKLIGQTPPPTFDPTRADIRSHLRSLIDRLPSGLKRLCELKIAGFSAKEMSERLWISVAEVRTREVQLRKKLTEAAKMFRMNKRIFH
ncbi:MAG TPA: sigma-70 family RNA polymerase sigma factor [Acidobacteriota bacterium]|nr:sigma-70 family RNA polymerase sigma factor [Acidobacteriota bacterium]